MPFFATLACSDVRATLAWYRDALGFGVMFAAPDVNGQPGLIHLRRHKYQDILLRPGTGAGEPSTALSLTFNAEGEIEALAARAKAVPAVGRTNVQDPVNTPWNTRDLRVTDPEGNQLVFTSRRADPDPEASARFAAMFERSRKLSQP